MNNSPVRELELSRIALQKVEEAIHAYIDDFQTPFSGMSRDATDRIIEYECLKLKFRNQLLAIADELTTSLIDKSLADQEITQLKKESLRKGV